MKLADIPQMTFDEVDERISKMISEDNPYFTVFPRAMAEVLANEECSCGEDDCWEINGATWPVPRYSFDLNNLWAHDDELSHNVEQVLTAV